MRQYSRRIAILIFIVLLLQRPSQTEEEYDLFTPISQRHVTEETIADLVKDTTEAGEPPGKVSFRSCTFEAGAIAKLFAELPKMEGLELSTCRFCESEYQEWKTPPALKELDLSHSYITDYDLRILAKLDHLESLNMEGVPITGAGLSHLPQPSILKHLNLTHTALSNKDASILKRFKNLETLGLAHTYCSARAFYMCGIFPELEEVEVNIKLDPSGWFETLIRMPALKQLPGTDLVNLDLNAWKLKDEALALLDRDLPCKTLTISNNDLSDECLPALNHMPELSELYAEHCKLSGETLADTRQALKLRKLVLDENPITETGLENISKLSNLQFLSLRKCLAFVGPDRLKAFPHLNLIHLNLSANPITVEDIQFVNRMTKLQTLKLDDIPLRKEIFDQLSANTSIQYLTFYNSRGLTHDAIEQLAKMQMLRSIHFGGSDLSKKDAMFLKKTNPSIRIDLNSLYAQ